ncbi:hypothetical protein [Helicobacter sp. T3_23-1056]
MPKIIASHLSSCVNKHRHINQNPQSTTLPQNTSKNTQKPQSSQNQNNTKPKSKTALSQPFSSYP